MWYPIIYSDLIVGAFRRRGYHFQNSIIWLKDGIVFGYTTYHKCYETATYCWKDGKRPYENKKITAKERDVWMNMDRMTFMDYLDVWYIQRDNRNEYVHPTQKPVALTERMLRNNSKAGDIILETFGGSGSVLIGCEKMERACRAIELDPYYCDVIINRWQKYTGEKAVKIHSRTKDEINNSAAGENMPTD
jgi:DNA modification methylase